MHVYQTDGASRDPSCSVCGRDSCDNKICFESTSSMRTKQELNKLKEEKEKICPHCEGLISIRNPKGFCDHLYYPDECEVCKKIYGDRKKAKQKT